MRELALRSSVVLFAILSAAGCSLAGERALDGCPVGETCSPSTPNGLFFLGTPSSDNFFGGGFAATAAGGTQTVTVVTGENAGSPEFTGSFDAKSADASVFSIGAVKPPTLTLQGKAKGSAFLRLVEPGTEKLLDRVEVHVETIASASLYPQDLVLLIEKPDTTPWAVLAGATAPLVVRLLGEGPDRLVDEGLTVTPASGEATRKAWDLFEIKAPPAGEATFKIGAGGASFDAKAKVVAAIDTITPAEVLGGSKEEAHVPVGGETIVCFLARSAGVPTSGAAWSFAISENAELPPEGQAQGLSSCATIRGKAAGDATLTVTANDLTTKVTFVIDPKAAGMLVRKPQGRASFAGERAEVGGY